MAEFPALPVFTDALLGDTMHLTTTEFGAYMLMLVIAWRSPDCCLPNDDAYLARVTRAARAWGRMRDTLLAFWTVGTDGQLRQKRLTQERLRAAEHAEQARRAGKASALKRHQTRSTAVAATLQPPPNPTTTPLTLASTSSFNPPKVPQEEIQKLVSNAISKVSEASGPRYDTPKARRDRWLQKLTPEILRQLGPENGMATLEAYEQGDPLAKQTIEAIALTLPKDLERKAPVR